MNDAIISFSEKFKTVCETLRLPAYKLGCLRYKISVRKVMVLNSRSQNMLIYSCVHGSQFKFEHIKFPKKKCLKFVTRYFDDLVTKLIFFLWVRFPPQSGKLFVGNKFRMCHWTLHASPLSSVLLPSKQIVHGNH